MTTEETQSPQRLIPLGAALLIALFVFFSVQGRSAPGLQEAAVLPVHQSQPPMLDAEAYLVRLTDGTTLLAQRSRKRLAPASLTKIMTSAVAAEYLAPDEAIVFSAEAKTTEQRLSSARAGEMFLRDEVIRLALISSANDAALALAEAVGKRFGRGSFRERIELFVQLMNRAALRRGLFNTRFQNPTGLDAADHYASAEDLAQLAEYIYTHHPALWEMTRRSTETIFSWQAAPQRIQNTNELLTEFPALYGGKTGFTDEAQGTLLLLYPVPPDKTAIIVILKSEDRFGDGRKIIKWLEENKSKIKM